ncbi:MAG: winged helix-turn-helix transcriptional regulator [Hyphomicrobiaceae bacterium]|nr:winged helix-turn-helix transcriptional regulator [Hyphomicrobiaceae bacterium]
MRKPVPGKAVRGSTTGRPVMALLDLLGRRMTLRVVWELRHGPLTFRALEAAAETNPSVLNARLAELREARLVAHADGGYALTALGRELLELLEPFHAWADKWAVAQGKGPAKRGP